MFIKKICKILSFDFVCPCDSDKIVQVMSIRIKYKLFIMPFIFQTTLNKAIY